MKLVRLMSLQGAVWCANVPSGRYDLSKTRGSPLDLLSISPWVTAPAERSVRIEQEPQPPSPPRLGNFARGLSGWVRLVLGMGLVCSTVCLAGLREIELRREVYEHGGLVREQERVDTARRRGRLAVRELDERIDPWLVASVQRLPAPDGGRTPLPSPAFAGTPAPQGAPSALRTMASRTGGLSPMRAGSAGGVVRLEAAKAAASANPPRSRG